MSIGAFIGMALGLGLMGFGAGWMAAHAIRSRNQRTKDRPR